MTNTELLVDAFERIRDAVHPAANGLTEDDLAFRPKDGANSIAWLIWHLTRIQDDHVSALAGKEQVWTRLGWADRFALPLHVKDTGYGHGPEDVPKVKAPASMLLDYFEDVHENTIAYLQGLPEDELRRIIDTNWDPPVTVSTRLISVIADDLQHAGQAAYVRGILLLR